MFVSQILATKDQAAVITLPTNAKVSDAAKLLSEKRIGTVVVSEDGTTPEGILSERDIVRELGKRGTACMTESICDYMTSSLVTCAPSDNVQNVLEKMTEGRFRHMPVLDNGKLVGLISLGDVVKAQLSELAMEKDALVGMIHGA